MDPITERTNNQIINKGLTINKINKCNKEINMWISLRGITIIIKLIEKVFSIVNYNQTCHFLCEILKFYSLQ